MLDRRLVFRRRLRREVGKPQQQMPAVVPRMQAVQQREPSSTDRYGTGRDRRNTDADHSSGSSSGSSRRGSSRAPVAFLCPRRAVHEVAEFVAAAPAGFARVHHLGILAEGEPGFEHLLGGEARGAAQLHRIAHIAAGEGVGLHQGGEAADLLHDVVLRAARQIEDAHAPAAVRSEQVTHRLRAATRWLRPREAQGEGSVMRGKLEAGRGRSNGRLCNSTRQPTPFAASGFEPLAHLQRRGEVPGQTPGVRTSNATTTSCPRRSTTLWPPSLNLPAVQS